MWWLEGDKREGGEGGREELDYLTHLPSTGAGEDDGLAFGTRHTQMPGCLPWVAVQAQR